MCSVRVCFPCTRANEMLQNPSIPNFIHPSLWTVSCFFSSYVLWNLLMLKYAAWSHVYDFRLKIILYIIAHYVLRINSKLPGSNIVVFQIRPRIRLRGGNSRLHGRLVLGHFALQVHERYRAERRVQEHHQDYAYRTREAWAKVFRFAIGFEMKMCFAPSLAILMRDCADYDYYCSDGGLYFLFCRCGP